VSGRFRPVSVGLWGVAGRIYGNHENAERKLRFNGEAGRVPSPSQFGLKKEEKIADNANKINRVCGPAVFLN
jgi:hypothetical protein